jgi:RNA polymerase sigma-70 factor (ECF subfamily)
MEDGDAGRMDDTRSAWLRGLLSEHAAYVGRALRYLGVPERDLPDACQEVFVVVARKHADLRDDTAPRAWLYAIAVNVARNARRTARRRPEVPTAELPETPSAPAQQRDLEQRDRQALALRLLATISDEQREVFVLHDVEELTMAEITAGLEIPLKTGYSRLRLAREGLARAAARARTRGETP